MKKFLLSVALLFVFASGYSQTFNADSLKNQMIKDWVRAKDYTNEYLQAMPANKYSWRAHDSIRTYAEQMLHLAQGTISLVANGTGKERIFPGRILEKSATAQTKDSVLYLVNASYDFAIDAIKNTDGATLLDPVKRGTFAETKYSYIQKAFEHQTHHRGQCTIYIRLQGIRPPAEKLF